MRTFIGYNTGYENGTVDAAKRASMALYEPAGNGRALGELNKYETHYTWITESLEYIPEKIPPGRKEMYERMQKNI